MSAVDARIAQLQARNASAARLAELSCLAVRLEPHLLRSLRRRFLPWSEPSAELDLWHSTLVQSRSATAAVLDITVQARMRELLSADRQRHEAYEATLACFAYHSPLQRFEIELNALPVLNSEVSDAAIEAHFEPLLAALREGAERARRLATWILQAAPRWHPRVRNTAAAWASIIAASALLEGRRVVRDAPPVSLDSEQLGKGLPPGLSATREIGVALTRRKLHILPAQSENAAKITVAVMAPALMLLEVEGEAPRVIDAQPGMEYDLPGVSSVTLRGLLGDGWHIELPARSGGSPQAAEAVSTRFAVRMYARYYTPQTLTLEVQMASNPPRDHRLELQDPIAPMRFGPMQGWREDAWNRVGRDVWNTLAFLEEAEVVMVDADELGTMIPWESMPIAGAQLLRALPRLPVENMPARARSGSREALVIDLYAQPIDSDANRAASIERQTKARVRRLQPSNAREAFGILFAEPLGLLHIVGPRMAQTTDGRFGIPLSDDFVLTAAEVQQLRSAPEMVFLEVPQSVAAPWQPDSARGALVAAFLAAGTRIAIALCDEIEWVIRNEFVDLLYRRLLAGTNLLEAVLHARRVTNMRYPAISPQRYFQVWGKPDAVLSIARVRRPARRLAAFEKSVLAMRAPGETAQTSTGFWIGNGLIVTAKKHFDGVPVIAGSDGTSDWQFAVAERAAQAESGDDSKLLFAWQVGGRPGPLVALARSVTRGMRQPGQIMMRSGVDIRLSDVDIDYGTEGVIRVMATDAYGGLPDTVFGAPIFVDGECIGVVIAVDPEQSTRLIATDADQLREDVQDAWRVRIRALIAAHQTWLATERRDGRRLSVPGIVITKIDLSNAILDRANLRRVRIEETMLNKASLIDANLEGARLDGVDLRDAVLKNANMARAKLAGIDARGADFSGADLSQADVSRTDMRDAILDGAKVDGARFEGTDLRGTRLSGVALDSIVGTPRVESPNVRLRIYVSSTHADLGEEREAVRRAVQEGGHETVAMEDYPATEHTPIEQSARTLSECDIAIFIIGWRYGYVSPDRESNPRGLSFVELEYEEAQRLGKRVLAFLASERRARTVSQSDEYTGEARHGMLIRQFRGRLSRELPVAHFDSAADLVLKVRVAIADVKAEFSRNRPGAQQSGATEPS